MDDLTFIEGVLGRTSATIAYPATPGLSERVMRAVSATPPPERRAARLAYAGAAAVLVAGVAATVAVPSSREAVADFFGIEGSKVEILPTSEPGMTPMPAPTPQDIDQSAVLSSLAGAGAAAGFRPALARGEEPTAVYVVDYGRSVGVILRYEGFDLWQVDGGSFQGQFGKGVPSTATVTDLVVGGVPARWISGGGHYVEYSDGAGVAPAGDYRFVERSTLIWRTEAALYRIETDLSLDSAIAIAETLP
jgi:hypothetical protein